ncbi:MAG: hypothetical protein F4Z74_09220 [Acidobacteria bacterium]|nr:hypothetical protein [Acidobacteriota bacterium]MYE43576.1 hypothetical protein [Acidobacteriota bacterium]
MSRKLALLVLLAVVLAFTIPATAEANCTWEALSCIQSVWDEYHDCSGSNCAAVRDFQLEVCVMIFEWCDA